LIIFIDYSFTGRIFRNIADNKPIQKRQLRALRSSPSLKGRVPEATNGGRSVEISPPFQERTCSKELDMPTSI
jgi:hypothetical protein